MLKKLREDIEIATDKRVLNTLNEEDYINYGDTLLTVLSNNYEMSKLQTKFFNLIDFMNK